MKIHSKSAVIMVYVGFPLKKKSTGNNTGPARQVLTEDKKREIVS